MWDSKKDLVNLLPAVKVQFKYGAIFGRFAAIILLLKPECPLSCTAEHLIWSVPSRRTRFLLTLPAVKIRQPSIRLYLSLFFQWNYVNSRLADLAKEAVDD